jgi:hypothetical protein
MDTLGGNQSHLLTGRKHLRNSVSDVIEERAQCTQTLIPSLDVIVAVNFQMLKKTLGLFKGKILQPDLGDPSPLVFGRITEKQSHSVPVTPNRCWL